MLDTYLPLLCTHGITLSRHLEEQPKQRWKKAQLKQWLDSKGVL